MARAEASKSIVPPIPGAKAPVYLFAQGPLKWPERQLKKWGWHGGSEREWIFFPENGIIKEVEADKRKH